MKKKGLLLSLLGLSFGLFSVNADAAVPLASDDGLIVYVAEAAMPSSAYKTPEITLDGTGASVTITVSAADLKNDVSIEATSGFSVSETTLKAGEETLLTITNTSFRKKNVGKVIMRSGDFRTYVNLTSIGSSLASKDIRSSSVSLGDGESQTFPGFSPTGNGYTVEFRARVSGAGQVVEPFAVSESGVGFKGYVTPSSVGLYNGSGTFVSEKSLSNPSNGGTFYNTDGEYHTYRYAVTPDERVIVYRDGITVDSMRVADLALQPDWVSGNGEEKENLLRNGDFEGEYDYMSTRGIVGRIEGWDVYPWDQWNSTQGIASSERSNLVDQNNHALWLDRYMWDAGWAAGEISQIVNVAPSETYSFSALAKGGVKSDGTLFGSIRIYDLQNSDNTAVLPVTSDSWQTYATEFETLANTEQVRVSFYLERASWGASVSSLYADDVRLTGVSREVRQQIGFVNGGAEIDYFAFDDSGAYAPMMATLDASVESLDLYGFNDKKSFTVDMANLVGDVMLQTSSGFAVTPSVIKAGTKSATVTVTNTTYRKKNTGKLVLRSGDMRTNIALTSYGSDLEPKDISENPVYTGGSDEEKKFDNFTPTNKGYTVEMLVKIDNAAQNVEPFAVTKDGVGFKGFVTSAGTGLYNGKGTFISEKSFSNPSNGGTFYNTDGEYHTYRYAVTPDERVIVYRDGITIDSMRVADLATQPEWLGDEGAVKKNLIKNGDFEGEYDYMQSRSIVGRIEGWDVYPWDQYNSTQGIASSERSNTVDQNNHAMWVDRYMWNDGWAAGEISQIVDVAPNEYYSFSALAKGGIYSGSPLGSIRISDLQNADNKVEIPVTSESWATYATEFETLANTEQIRVSFYLERAKWGASVSSLYADDVTLRGVSREINQQIGFVNNGADIKYFAFDCTGAYAPSFPTLQEQDIFTAVESVEAEAQYNISASVRGGVVSLYGVSDGSKVAIYTTNGTPVTLMSRYVNGTGIALPARGTYIILIEKDGNRKTVKVIN